MLIALPVSTSSRLVRRRVWIVKAAKSALRASRVAPSAQRAHTRRPTPLPAYHAMQASIAARAHPSARYANREPTTTRVVSHHVVIALLGLMLKVVAISVVGYVLLGSILRLPAHRIV